MISHAKSKSAAQNTQSPSLILSTETLGELQEIEK